jgi:hypothetical protein
MTAEVSGPRGRAPRPAREVAANDVAANHVASADVVSRWTQPGPRSVAIGRFGGLSRRQWIIAVVLIIVAAIDMTRGYALIMSSVNTMEHSGESSNVRSVVGQPPASTNASTNVTKNASTKK